MATKTSKPLTRSRRNLPSPAASAPNLEALHGLIEQERERLIEANDVLHCVICAMERDVRMDAPGPGYANVLRIVRGLVSSTIDQLDSVHVKAVLQQRQEYADIAAATSVAGKDSEPGGVKETPPPYVH